MSYTVKNIQVFNAVYSGCLGGMGVSDRNITDTQASAYAGVAAVAGAFAQAVDTAWGNVRAATLLDVYALITACEGYWQDRSPLASQANTNPATHAKPALAIIAIVTAGEGYYAGEGITPPSTGGGGGAVIIDGGNPAVSENLRANRAGNNSPIDNTLNGIVNLASDTTGTSQGARADFATINGGDANEIRSGADHSTIGGGQGNVIGTNCTSGTITGGVFNTISDVTCYNSVIGGGSSNVCDGQYTAVFSGQSNKAGNVALTGLGNDACVVHGQFCNAFGESSMVLFGYTCNALGAYSQADGYVTKASRGFQRAFGNSNATGGGPTQFSDQHVTLNSAAGVADTFNFLCEDDQAYFIKIECVAQTSGGNTIAAFEYTVLAKCVAGIASVPQVIAGANNAALSMATGWTLAVTVTGADQNVNISFTGDAGHNVKASIKLSYVEQNNTF